MWYAVLAWFLALTLASAAPFARKFTYCAPDGQKIELWGQGDEFFAVFETLDGYTVVFNQQTKSYHYATISADGNDFVATGLRVGSGDPRGLGLPTHLRLSSEAVKAKVAPLRQAWEQSSGIPERWRTLKAAAHARDVEASDDDPLPGPPPFTTVGTKVGLTLLVDFEDEPAMIPYEEIVQFLNSDNYTNFGCNGSVKQYFLDNSNGRLLFTNVVVPYVRIPNSVHPRSYYADTSRGILDVAPELLNDALALLRAKPNFNTDILPLFDVATADSHNNVVSMNLFYAGPGGGVWGKGLFGGEVHYNSWWNYWTQLTPGGKCVNRFQFTPMEHDLSLYIFCHENGHSMCGFPDLYDYDYDSTGGAGDFCIMGGRPNDDNPPQFCAYLKAAAGWASIKDIYTNSVLTASVSVNAGWGQSPNEVYRFRRPAVSTEYFLIENRQRHGHDASIPASGIAIWHIDELGNRDNQSLATNSIHANYECTLEQADNQWHFEYYRNPGDSCDLFYRGPRPTYTGCFSDATAPSALWWDGTPSGLSLFGFSAAGETMSFKVGPLPSIPEIAGDPVDQTVAAGCNASFSVSAYACLPLSYQWFKEGQSVPGGTSSVLVLTNVTSNLGGIAAVVSTAQGAVTSAPARLEVISDSGIVTWGNNDYGQCSVPPGLSAVQAIAGGRFFSLALLSNGTVRAWGDNARGQCSVPDGLSGVTSISAGAFFGLALRRNGRVVAWGADDYGQTSRAAGLTGVSAVSAGQYHALALQSNGTVVAWGENGAGQVSVPSGLINVREISAGYKHSLALKCDGTVVGWGSDGGAERVPPGLSNVISILAGLSASLALKSDGSVLAWGTNTYGGLDVPDSVSDVAAIAGYAHFMVLKSNGTVVAWGGTGVMKQGQADVPAGLTNVAAIASNGRHSLALVRKMEQPPVQLLEPVLADGIFRAEVRSVSGHSYFLEFKENLTDENWTSLPGVSGDGQLRLLADPNPPATQRFYRVRVQ